MNPLPENILRCPECATSLYGVLSGNGAFVCEKCGARYPVQNGVLDLVPEIDYAKSLSQFFMESPFIVRIYESRLWRRSPVFFVFTGISFEKEADIIGRAARIEDARTILDLACGPGIYARSFARNARNGHVVGLDLSRPMLAYAETRARAEGVRNVTFLRGNAMQLPFVDNAFEVVNCCAALHLFADTERALSEMVRVLAPGGRLTLAVFRRWNRAMAYLLHRIGGVRSFTPDSLDPILRQSGLHEVQIPHQGGIWMIVSAVKP